jgi:hypothetical protein
MPSSSSDMSLTAPGIQVPKKPANNGPPPLAWRGRSSVYSRNVFVSPIPEESVESTPIRHVSMATNSMAFSTRGSEMAESDILGAFHDSYMSASDDDDDDDHDGDNNSKEEWRSVESSIPYPESLVRQASLGKRGKPSLRMISGKPSNELMSISPSENPRSPPKSPSDVAAAVGGSYLDTHHSDKSNESNIGKKTSNPSHPRESSLDSGSVDFDNAPIILDESSMSPIESSGDPSDGLRNYATRNPGFGAKVPENRRPPWLNMDAVKGAEARGSLTSLPDLIRRATQLASNLDRGKTASRLGLWEFMNPSGESKAHPSNPDGRRGSGSLSDMLASFPPPRNDTPDQRQTLWPFSPNEKLGGGRRDWKPLQTPTPTQTPTPNKRNRRCCGMRLWVFLLLCTVVLILVVAAIVIPIVLIVIPRNKSHSASVVATNSCPTTLPCSNGGVSVLSNNVCTCVCIDGFYGRQCGQSGDSNCTTQAAVDAVLKSNSVTVGSALPAVFNESSSIFNISLNETEILGLFSTNDVSCTDQNALVSFASNGSTEANANNIRVNANQTAKPLSVATPGPKANVVAQRDAASLVTSDGILFQPTSSSNPTSTTSRTSHTSSANPTCTSVPVKVIEFSRVAVLYILGQTRSMTDAFDAQTDIAIFLNENWSENVGTSTPMDMNMTSMTLPVSFALNFVNFTITSDNGTVVGGGTNKTTSSSKH